MPIAKIELERVVARRYLRQGKAIRQVASLSSLCQRFLYAPFNAKFQSDPESKIPAGSPPKF